MIPMILMIPIAVFRPSGLELTKPQKSLQLISIVFLDSFYQKCLLPVTGEDPNNEGGDEGDGDEALLKGEGGPVLAKLL